MNEFETFVRLNFWGLSQEVLLVTKLRETGLDDTRILAVLRIIDNTCGDCHDGDNPCYCTCDE